MKIQGIWTVNRVLLSLILLCSFIGIGKCAIVSELISEARILARDPISNDRARFTNAEILVWINEGYRDITTYSMCLENSTSTILTSGTTYYKMPADFLTSSRVLFQSSYTLSGNTVTQDKRVLGQTTKTQLDKQTQSWENSEGEPLKYFVDYSSRTSIGLYPVPSTTTETGYLTVEYIATGVDLAETDTPYIGYTDMFQFQRYLTYYAVYNMMLVDGLPSYQFFFNEYIRNRSLMFEQCKIRPGYRPQMIPKLGGRQ